MIQQTVSVLVISINEVVLSNIAQCSAMHNIYTSYKYRLCHRSLLLSMH